ncbi:allophanate hydrolase [Diaphorobacter sp. JS3051]|uniref:allophanate hydrolase n=1 Tax=Diaphorobacter sp. JS3051 TaxID=2792224 RepID=UPI0018C946CA|nr:allophanate hydrolase [Diaphorobacter sp. JS3051]QPN29749.1 allophanate hydrolase [Diaphorobacter sp. JS3051]
MTAGTTSLPSTIGWTLAQWQHAYREGGLSPALLIGTLVAGLDAADPAWIAIAAPEQLREQFARLDARLAGLGGDRARLPLFGIPFAAKDNLDAAGWPTTAACPAFAYVAEHDAEAIARLKAAGAILVGKTNLDQFATGLVGTRSPYGVVPNTFNPAYISGGSSSGSASVVARGLVPFALGTDTAGSGRVPAAFNNIVGLKPTKGWVSTTGLVPACRTQDCITAFALTVEDAAQAVQAMAGCDEADPYSLARPEGAVAHFPQRPRLAIPAEPDFCGDKAAARHYANVLQRLRAQGAELVEIDFAPFLELAQLLYQGPWVAERHVAIAPLLEQQPQAVHPTVRAVIEPGAGYSASDAFRAEYRRAALARTIRRTLAQVDALAVPSTPSIFTIQQLMDEPVSRNAALGIYTNFTNLADLCALALPAGLREDGLPAGLTLIAPAWHDWALADFGLRWQAAQEIPPGAPGVASAAHTPAPARHAAGADEIVVAVVGAHLRGMPLNHQLTRRGGRFLEETYTSADDYRLYALPGTTPRKPGLRRMPGQGAPIAVELWALAPHAFGEFTAEVPRPLGIGNVELADGRMVKGFICEPAELECAEDITAFGGWRAYSQSLEQQEPTGR